MSSAWPTCLMCIVREKEAFWALYPSSYQGISAHGSSYVDARGGYLNPMLLISNAVRCYRWMVA